MSEAVNKLRLELVVVPVSDVDRAKAFYVDQVGFHCDVDFAPNEHFRVVQLTPNGSACSISLMKNPDAAGSVKGLHLVVQDMAAVRAELVGRGGRGQRAAPLRRRRPAERGFADPGRLRDLRRLRRPGRHGVGPSGGPEPGRELAAEQVPLM